MKIRSVELNIPQRCCAHNPSLTDATEAFECGASAVRAALAGETGKMISIVRADGTDYKVSFDATDINTIANNEKIIPDNFISPDGNDVTEEFIKYARPLIMGEREIIFENGIPAHIVR